MIFFWKDTIFLNNKILIDIMSIENNIKLQLLFLFHGCKYKNMFCNIKIATAKICFLAYL
ncbi:hypothetical protein EZS27_023093 [termite gut metagenome]|uniref:Uncharacterized protein n=1 Tax=termite gut metagenome TaxID=433724 RepID=A0A5J4R330_9ZZZZ